MLGASFAKTNQTVEPEAFRSAELSLDFARRRFRIAGQTSPVLENLNGVFFQRPSTDTAAAQDGVQHTFSEHIPRLTDRGIYLSHPDLFWIDLQTPLSELTLLIEFERSGWAAGMGYLNAVRVVRTSDERDAASLFNDHVTGNVVRYRVDVDNTSLLGPNNLGATSEITSAVLSIGSSATSLTTNEGTVTGAGSSLGSFDRIYVGRRDAAGGPMNGFIRKLILWTTAEAYQV